MESSSEFKAEWSAKKEYVRKASSKYGSYAENKEKRRSEEFSWPQSGLIQIILFFDLKSTDEPNDMMSPYRIFKLREGASIPTLVGRLVGWLVCLSVCRENFKIQFVLTDLKKI